MHSFYVYPHITPVHGDASLSGSIDSNDENWQMKEHQTQAAMLFSGCSGALESANENFTKALALIADMRSEIEKPCSPPVLSRMLAMHIAESEPRARKRTFANLIRDIKEGADKKPTGRMFIKELRDLLCAHLIEPVDDTGSTITERVEAVGTSSELDVAKEYYSAIAMPTLISQMQDNVRQLERAVAMESVEIQLPQARGSNIHMY